MAKKAQKSSTKQAFDIKPAFYSIVLDLDFCEDLAKFIAKNKGTGMIAAFGKNMHKAACLSKPEAVDREADKFVADAERYAQQVTREIKAAVAKATKVEKTKREKLIKQAKLLRKKGKSFRAISKELNVSAITVARYCKK
jgi:hypothetical protein